MKIRFRKAASTTMMAAHVEPTVSPEWIRELADVGGIELEQLPIRIQKVPAETEQVEHTVFWEKEPIAVLVVNGQDASDLQVMHGAALREAVEKNEVEFDVPSDRSFFAVAVESESAARGDRLFVVHRDEFAPGGVRDVPFAATDLPKDDSRPVAVLIHGWSSRSDRNFEALKLELLESGEYAKVYAYSYPSLEHTVKVSSDAFYDMLNGQGILSLSGKIDIFAHSLGGLVSRKMLQDHQDLVGRVRFLTTAGTPHLGTPLAKAAGVLGIDDILKEFGGFLVAERGHVTVENATALTQFMQLIDSFRDRESSTRDMAPGSAFLQQLNATTMPAIDGIILAATHFEPERPTLRWEFLNRLFEGKPHDGVVPLESASTIRLSQAKITQAEMAKGNHSSYYTVPDQVKRIRQAVPVLVPE